MPLPTHYQHWSRRSLYLCIASDFYAFHVLISHMIPDPNEANTQKAQKGKAAKEEQIWFYDGINKRQSNVDACCCLEQRMRHDNDCFRNALYSHWCQQIYICFPFSCDFDYRIFTTLRTHTHWHFISIYHHFHFIFTSKFPMDGWRAPFHRLFVLSPHTGTQHVHTSYVWVIFPTLLLKWMAFLCTLCEISFALIRWHYDIREEHDIRAHSVAHSSIQS